MTARAMPRLSSGSSATDELVRSVDDAAQHIAECALSDGPVGRVGLELEAHLVDLASPARRPDGAAISGLLAALPELPNRSPITVEPGAQIEISPPPAPDLASAVAGLREDRAALKQALAEFGYGSTPLGTDPARPAVVVTTAARYAAMQRHWAAVGCATAGRRMMAATAALQVNLDAGPSGHWSDRVAHLHRIGPALVAVSACSPMLAGRASGWRSMRQQIWAGIDRGRAGRIPVGDPVTGWVSYALAAPVMLVRDHETGDAEPVPSRVSLASWITGDAKLIRRPTLRDLDYHLTTLFPAVRPRGFLEIRYLDAVPDRWWPGLAGITAVLADHPQVAAAADEACEPVADAWLPAAREGLRNDAIWRAARACVRLAAEFAPPAVAAEVLAWVDLVEQRRTPGDELSDRLARTDARTVLLEEARA